jgi:hypothetical protein
MIPHVKNVILASADQVAIDAVAARLMGFAFRRYLSAEVKLWLIAS